MDRDELLKHQEELTHLYDQYVNGQSFETINQFKYYLLREENSEIKEFILMKSGSGNHLEYLREIFTEKYFKKDMPRILRYIKEAIEHTED